MGTYQLIYWSQPFGFDEAMLAGILMQARRCNARDGITGALIARSDLFLQLIEGEEAAIEAAFARIARDDRHNAVKRLCAGPAAARLFPAWTMRDDPARSWLWSAADVADGALDAAPPAAVRGVFERLASETDELAVGARLP